MSCLRLTVLATLALVMRPAAAAAQDPGAPTYETVYADLRAIEPRADRVARVANLVLTRDAGTFTLVAGTVTLLSPVAGRTVGAVFEGLGTFAFAPPSTIEQDRLQRFEHKRSLDDRFNELVLFFTDSTLAQFERALQFGPGEVTNSRRLLARGSLDYLGDDDTKSFDPDLMAGFLNQDQNGVFYAQINRIDGGPVMFMFDPLEGEAVTLARRAPRIAWTREPEVICKFAAGGAAAAGDSAPVERRATATIADYHLDVTLTQTMTGDMAFATAARLRVTAATALGPWVAFELFPKLRLDSARTPDGRPLAAFRGKDADEVWVRLDRRLEPGDTRDIVLAYHGDLIDRVGSFYFIKTSISWYPLSLDGRSYATFDITFHSPAHLRLASVGERTDSSVVRRVLTTRWTSVGPIRNASFNLGLFEDYTVREADVPPVTVLVSEEAHRQLSQILTQQRKMKETVGTDVVQSLRFFQRVYGAPDASRFYATEVPDLHGEAFPGMVNLSWATFQQTDLEGQDLVFRAHEVAHQWWGIGVDYATYHDQWLSEGFADFSGLWYLQTALRDNNKYFGVLRHWRADIMLHKDEPSPLWLGYRTTTSKDQTGYQALVYEKGAWVLHMLRMMMLDLQTMKEDQFTDMMQDFYRSYRGRRASTADFQRVVERHIGMPMDWFFQEWVYGTAIPTYHVSNSTDRLPNGKFRVTLHVSQDNVSDDFRMYVPVAVDLGDRRVVRFLVNVRGAESQIVLPLLPSEPKGVKFNDLEGVLCEVK